MSEQARGFPAFPPVGVRSGRFAQSWWGRAWIAALEDTALDDGQLRQGRKYARAGYVGAITVSPGRLSATVRDYEDDTAYPTLVRIEPFDAGDWARFLDQVAAESGHIAALLDRDVPAALVDAAAEAGVRLLPGIGDLDPRCPCPGWELPCRHAAALAYQAAWLLDADPFLLLLLRGKDEATLLAELRERDAPADGGGTPAAEAFAKGAPPLPEPPPVPEAAPPASSVPPVEGVDPEGLALIAADAALRARRMMAADVPALDLKADTVRFAAEHPAAAPRLRPHHPDLDRAVAAWEQGGPAALAVLESSWRPAARELARARDVLEPLLEGDEVAVERNHVTVADVQLRYGRDGRWYPYRARSGGWWPAGPPQPDAATALLTLLG